MNEIMVAKINAVPIICIEEDRGKLIPIRPICNALGIDYSSQYTKIKDDPDLSSTVVLGTTVASNGFLREMACLQIGRAHV